MTLDSAFYSKHGSAFHNQHPEEPMDCLHLLQASPSITYLNHESAIIRLTRQDGPRTTFKVFGSPYSPGPGIWAFEYHPERASHLWATIPLDTDIVVTHTPPKDHCDKSKNGRTAGCEILRQYLWRVRPRLAICGHIHDARGAERVRWGLSSTNPTYKEGYINHWSDPGEGNRKQSLIDLSSRYMEPLDNNGENGVVPRENTLSSTIGSSEPGLVVCPPFSLTSTPPNMAVLKNISSGSDASSTYTSTTTDFLPKGIPLVEEAPTYPASRNIYHEESGSTTNDQADIQASKEDDLETLRNISGRRETCIINAAIMATSWPHRHKNGRKYNKAIVVDIDLPVWEDQM